MTTQDSEAPKHKSYQFFLVIALIVFITHPWNILAHNLIFIGYSIFGELRLAIVFFSFASRLILYPLRILSHIMRNHEIVANKEFEHISKITDETEKKLAQSKWLGKHRHVLLFLFFQFLFMIMTALVIGRMFYTPFTPERLQGALYPFVSDPVFPLKTTGFIPFVGDVDLTQINNKLNFISAFGAAIVGFFEVVMHKKFQKRELFIYLIVYPAGAYFITSKVPSGFEFSMVVFEILTLISIFIEKAIGLVYKKLIKASDHQFQI